jgi:exodeoxyribonuclease-3
MKLATWNVNSLKVRLPQLLSWLAQSPVDVVCLQETKLADDAFPAAELAAAGYHVAFSGQKTYNGVAIASRLPLTEVQAGNPRLDDGQKRLLAVTVTPPDGPPLRVISAYVPNGQAVGSDKYEYKLRWLAALADWLRDEMAAHPRLAIAGDYNIAPDDRDVHDPAAWAGQILCSDDERRAFSRLLDLGLADAFRLFEQPGKSFSWWDYRMMGFRRNHGLRIDHVLLSKALAGTCTACTIDRAPRGWERPSDHAPVVADLATGSAS